MDPDAITDEHYSKGRLQLGRDHDQDKNRAKISREFIQDQPRQHSEPHPSCWQAVSGDSNGRDGVPEVRAIGINDGEYSRSSW